jgi:hypothetical protein
VEKRIDPRAPNVVARAFVVGWQIAELFHRAAPRSGDVPGCPKRLPGLADLSPADRTELGVLEIEAAIAHLRDQLQTACVETPSTQPLRQALTDGDVSIIRREVCALHRGCLSSLTATDFRLGTAFNLGRALADTRLAGRDVQSLREQFREGRVAKLEEWLADLRSALPEHAAVAVSRTLRAWCSWVAQVSVADERAWSQQHGGAVHQMLWRQGQLWRALLSGERCFSDTLSERHYLSAAATMFDRARALLWRLAIAHAIAVASVLLLATAATGLLISSTSFGETAAGIGAVTAALGITWAGLGRGFFNVLEMVRAPLWNAALDQEAGDAITLLPNL